MKSDSRRTLILHIGTPKTGTSHIQFVMTMNRIKLRKYGIEYPEVNPSLTPSLRHASLVRLIQSGNGDNVIDLIVSSFRHAPVVLLSAERFYAYLAKQRLQFLQWLDKARAVCDELKVVVYVRRQDLYAQAAYRSGVRNPFGRRLTVNFDEFSGWGARKLNFHVRLEEWRQEVGCNNMILRPFEKQQWVNNNLVDDFLTAIGLEELPGLRIPKRNINRTYGAVVTELLRRTNGLRDVTGQEEALKLLYKVLPHDILYDREKGHSYLTPAEQLQFMQKYKGANRAIATDWLGRQDGILFYDTINPDDPDCTVDLSDSAVKSVQDTLRDRLVKRRWFRKYKLADATRLGLC